MLTFKETVEAYSQTGVRKVDSGALRLLILSMLAGFQVAAAGHVSTIASFAVENVSLAKLISGALFPIGLITIILTGTELFTGNCLITISLLDRRVKLGGMVRNLVLVYLGNFIGSLALAAIVVYCGQLGLGSGMLAGSYIRVAAAKCSLSFADAFFKGIICNLMVCMGVFCAVSAKDVTGKVAAAFFPVMAFVIMGAEHCVANMFYVPAGLFAAGHPVYGEMVQTVGAAAGALGWGSFAVKNLLPVTLGNIVGGCGFAAVMRFSHAGNNK